MSEGAKNPKSPKQAPKIEEESGIMALRAWGGVGELAHVKSLAMNIINEGLVMFPMVVVPSHESLAKGSHMRANPDVRINVHLAAVTDI